MYTCEDCGAVFPNRQALGGHRSVVSCGVNAPSNPPPGASPATTNPPAATNPPLAANPPPPVNPPPPATNPPRPPVVHPPEQLSKLLLRPTHDLSEHRVVDAVYTRGNAQVNVTAYKLYQVKLRNIRHTRPASANTSLFEDAGRVRRIL